jgi:serine/threonine protein kinase
LNFKEKKMNSMKKEEMEITSKRLGEEFNSKYELIEKLGKGGFGEVYKVKDKILNRLCALKILDIMKLAVDDDNERESTKQLFIREAQTLAQCRHDHIVQVYEVAGLDHIPYIVMQFVEGKNLLDLINDEKKLSFSKTLGISGAVLPALQYIHSKGLVHRDLKPENIMIEAGSEKVVIIDFGLAIKYIDSKTADKFEPIKGTLLYMAPEIWKKRQVNSKADIYSYGVILFRMLTGEAPFEGDFGQVKAGHLEGKVPKVKQKNKAVPSGIQKVIEKAMAKDPLERYADASELLDAIKKAQKEDEGYPSIEVQKQLADRYTFEGELIGEGQFSKVYSMRHLTRGGEYALKIMDLKFTLEDIKKTIHEGENISTAFEKRKKRFIEKANFFYALKPHPNIVDIDNAGFVPMEHENIKFMLPYVALKRIRGVKLEEFIREESPLPLGKILNIALGILSALQSIHEKGYTYWEVIPRKIFIEEKTGNPVLLSAGLPSDKDIVLEWVSQTKVSDTRLIYVRDNVPRGYNRKERGIASDISLFGILLYQMIMGEIYDKEEDINLFEILKVEDVEILRNMKSKSGFPEDLLKDLLRITWKTMGKGRWKKYQSTKNIIKDLEKIGRSYLSKKV